MSTPQRSQWSEFMFERLVLSAVGVWLEPPLGDPFDDVEGEGSPYALLMTRLGRTYLPARVAKKLDSSRSSGVLAGEMSWVGSGVCGFEGSHVPVPLRVESRVLVVVDMDILRSEKRRFGVREIELLRWKNCCERDELRLVCGTDGI